MLQRIDRHVQNDRDRSEELDGNRPEIRVSARGTDNQGRSFCQYVWLGFTAPLQLLMFAMRLLYLLTKSITRPVRRRMKKVREKLHGGWNYVVDVFELYARRYLLIPLAVRVIDGAIRHIKTKNRDPVKEARQSSESFIYPKLAGLVCVQYIRIVYVINDTLHFYMKKAKRPTTLVYAHDKTICYLRECFDVCLWVHDTMNCLVHILRICCHVFLIVADTISFLAFLVEQATRLLYIFYYVLYMVNSALGKVDEEN